MRGLDSLTSGGSGRVVGESGALEAVARGLGADMFGVADLAPAAAFIAGQAAAGWPEARAADFPRAISVGVRFPAEVARELLQGPTHTYLYYYNVVNACLDQIALRVAAVLVDLGYRSFPVPASQRTRRDKLAGIFSHRLAAHLAGLGWIGKSCSLVTERFGPRVRLVTVLTDAPLPAGRPVPARCGNCVACVAACPCGAIKGVDFRAADPLGVRLDAQACHDYLQTVKLDFGKRVCGRCIAACPADRSTEEEFATAG